MSHIDALAEDFLSSPYCALASCVILPVARGNKHFSAERFAPPREKS
jgi:hypothetical protein